MRITIVSSCAGDKVVHDPRELTNADFEKGWKHVAQRETEFRHKLRRAGEMYTGEQHTRLMSGVSALRARRTDCEVRLWIVSAGYGLISEDRIIAPYNVTFSEMDAREIAVTAKRLELPGAFRAGLSDPYDLGLILLGDEYLTACGPDRGLRVSGPTLVFCSRAAMKKFAGIRDIRALPAGNLEATRFHAGSICLKGELANRILKRCSRPPAPDFRRWLDVSYDLYSELEHNPEE